MLSIRAFSQRGVWVFFGHPNIHIFVYNVYHAIIQCDEKELKTQFTPNVYFWTPNSEILAKL